MTNVQRPARSFESVVARLRRRISHLDLMTADLADIEGLLHRDSSMFKRLDGFLKELNSIGIKTRDPLG